MRPLSLPLLGLTLILACAARPERDPARLVHDTESLRAALVGLGPGSELWIEPGDYLGGHFLSGVAGTERRPVVIRGRDPARPPVFAGGGSQAWHLSACSHLVLSDLVVRGYSGNGVNVDDGGGGQSAPAVGIRIERLTIENTGPVGNHDALKLSGVDDFVVNDCVFLGWGGSAVDLVGCHDGAIEGCKFEGKEGFSQASGVQIKGGSARIALRRNVFLHAGARAVNAGGSTGLDYFRPRDALWEAEDVLIERNHFLGSEAPLAVVGARAVRILDNDFILPEKWVLRILQENLHDRFGSCRDGVFQGNRIEFDARVRVFVNVGPGTLPGTFKLEGNHWIERGPDGSALQPPRRPVWPPE